MRRLLEGSLAGVCMAVEARQAEGPARARMVVQAGTMGTTRAADTAEAVGGGQ